MSHWSSPSGLLGEGPPPKSIEFDGLIYVRNAQVPPLRRASLTWSHATLWICSIMCSALGQGQGAPWWGQWPLSWAMRYPLLSLMWISHRCSFPGVRAWSWSAQQRVLTAFVQRLCHTPKTSPPPCFDVGLCVSLAVDKPGAVVSTLKVLGLILLLM